MKRLYLYLASRSKKDIKLVTVLQSELAVNSRLESLQTLNLPQVWERKIQQIVHDNHMLYEPWIETAKDFNELKSRLKNRGFTDVPMGSSPLLQMQAYAKAPAADTSSCEVVKTMLRKMK